MNLSASLYQIDERGLELRRSYMGMTAAELELLSAHAGVGRAQRRRDRRQARRAHLRRTAPPASSSRTTPNGKGMRVADLQRGWGGAQAGHFKAIFAEAAKPGGFGIAYFEGLLGVGALHSRRSTCR